MSEPVASLVDRATDGALYLLKLDTGGPDVARVRECAQVVVELIHAALDRDVRYTDDEVPAPVAEAAAIATRDYYMRKDAPHGITGAWGSDGEAIRLARDPLAGVRDLLAPYRGFWGVA